MLRKLSICRPKLSLLKLREEATTNGIKRLSSKEEILKKISELKQNQQILIEDKIDDSDNSSYKFLPKSFIFSEIYKRNPDFTVSKDLPKTDLVQILVNILMEERSFGSKSLRIFVKMNGNNESMLSTKEIFSVLEGLQDPLNITQVDMNNLINSEFDALIPIWTFITKNIENLSLEEIRIALASATTVQTIFKKHFMRGEEKMSRDHLELFLQRALGQIADASVSDCASILKSSKILIRSSASTIPIQTIEKIQKIMLEKYQLGSELDPKILTTVIENLPSMSYKAYKPEITELITKLQPFLNELSSEQIINTLIGISTSGSKVPFKYFNSIEFISLDELKKIPRQTLLQLSAICIENKVVTQNLTGQILSSFLNSNTFDIEFVEMIADYLYMHKKANHFHLILNIQKTLNKVFQCENKLSLQAYLKIGATYGPHIDKPEIFTKILLELLNYPHTDPIFKENFNLVTELMSTLLHDSLEKPIYNYQFNSFEQIITDLKDRIIQELYKILRVIEPSNPNIFFYFSEYKKCKVPQLPDFDVNITESNLVFVCKSIWRHQIQQEVSFNVFKQFEKLGKFESEDFTEALYYLSSQNSQISELIKPEWLKPGPFYIATCYNLNLPISEYPNLPSTLNNEMNLFGEPLVKTLIKLSESSKSSSILHLTKNLNYTPSTFPPVPSDLVISFFKTLSTHTSKFDYSACSTFANSNLASFSKSEIPFLLAFFKDYWNLINTDLQKELEKNLHSAETREILFKGSNIATFSKVLQAQTSMEANKDNLEIIDILIKNCIYNSNLVQGYIELISLVNKEKAVKITSKLIELISLSGNHKGHFDLLVKQISNQNLWSMLSVEDFMNFFFIVHFSKHDKMKLPLNIEENFKYDLLKIEDNEILLEHPELKKKFYKPFIYTTEFEPRYLVSNDLEIRKVAPELNTEIEMPPEKILKYLKMYSLLVYYKINPTNNCVQAIKLYNKNRGKKLLIQRIKDELFNLISEDLKMKNIPIELQNKVASDTVLWKSDLSFNISNVEYLIVTNQDYCYDSNGKVIGISLINKVIKTQLEENNNIKVIPIVVDSWKNYDEWQKIDLIKVVADNMRGDLN